VFDGAPVMRQETSKNDDVPLLPENRDELDKMLAPYKMLVNPLLVGVSECCVLAGIKPLSDNERAGGTHAISAVFAQYFPGKFADSRFLLLVWVLGTIVPRALTWLSEQNKKPKQITGKVTATEVGEEVETARALVPA
jgi:hypothetical protein